VCEVSQTFHEGRVRSSSKKYNTRIEGASGRDQLLCPFFPARDIVILATNLQTITPRGRRSPSTSSRQATPAPSSSAATKPPHPQPFQHPRRPPRPTTRVGFYILDGNRIIYCVVSSGCTPFFFVYAVVMDDTELGFIFLAPFVPVNRASSSLIDRAQLCVCH
jgi:hypothetical protein